MNADNRDIAPTSDSPFYAEKTAPAVGRRKRQGRGFFLSLLVLSGIVILFLLLFSFKGREIHIFTFQKFVINKAFVALLPQEYTLEEAERVRETVYHFYENAGRDRVGDAALFQVSNRIRTMMGDEKITHDEVASLLALIEKSKGNR